MNPCSAPSLRTLVSYPFRLWDARLAYIASLLLLLLQRTPLLRVLADGKLLTLPRFANVLKFTSTVSAVQFAGTHAVTGATNPEVRPVDPSTNPETATVGEDFVWVWSASIPGKKARSYSVKGLPPGIEFNGQVASNSLAALQGIPTTPGEFDVEIVAFHFANLRGEASPPYVLRINVEGDAPVVVGPAIEKEIGDQLVALGQSVTLAVETTGDDLSYVWEKDGQAIPDNNQAILSLESVSVEDAGVYTVKVSNPGGEVSSSAQLDVIAAEIPIPAGHVLQSISSRDANLRTLDASGATTGSVPIGLEGRSVTGGTGLALDPTSGILYALLKLSVLPPNQVEDRVLATIDPGTGKATLIGNPAAEKPFKFSGLAFDAAGQLYGVTGDDPRAETPETLYTIDKETGVPTLFLALGNGDQGEAITFDPSSGSLAHASGGGPPETQILERVDLHSKEISTVDVQGGWKEGKAMVALSAGLLLADEEAFYLISDEGAVVPVGQMDHILKGLALVPEAGGPADANLTIRQETQAMVLTFDANVGDRYVIESSQDLLSWEDLESGTATGDSVSFTDGNAAGTPERYYRVQVD